MMRSKPSSVSAKRRRTMVPSSTSAAASGRRSSTWRAPSLRWPAAAASSSSTGRRSPGRSKPAISSRTSIGCSGNSAGGRACRSLTASLYGRLAAILAHVPIIIGTEVNIYERKKRHHALAERLLMAGTDRVIASAESVREYYLKQVHAASSKVDVIYNAVDFAQAE